MNAEHVKVLEELDALLDMQGRLLFSRENYNEVEAERFGVMLLDFMRRHGVMVRAAIAALKALDVEPVAWIHENGISLLTHYDMVRLHRVSVERRREWTPLYAAAPAKESANG